MHDYTHFLPIVKCIHKTAKSVYNTHYEQQAPLDRNKKENQPSNDQTQTR